ncbi:type II toxin-antitoxin system toxin DNA ADP-ribosyl transferase DarT [Peijinzhouia sedimentorum]
MIHIENIPHILEYGITHSTSRNANPNFVPIGDKSLITTRNDFKLNNSRQLGEYIPFYFGVRTPMLYVVQNGFNMVAPTPAENIVYCVSSVQKIINMQLEFVFTDGHAVDSFSSQYTVGDIQNIDTILDMNAINAKYWRDENDLDKKRRKEAEFLVLGDINKEAILGFYTYNEKAKNCLIKFGANSDNIHIRPIYYF